MSDAQREQMTGSEQRDHSESESRGQVFLFQLSCMFHGCCQMEGFVPPEARNVSSLPILPDSGRARANHVIESGRAAGNETSHDHTKSPLG